MTFRGKTIALFLIVELLVTTKIYKLEEEGKVGSGEEAEVLKRSRERSEGN